MQEVIMLHGGLVGARQKALENAREIIEKWEKAMADQPESLFLLNETQCTGMWRNFRRVYDAFEPSSSYPPNLKRKCLHVFIDLYNIVKRGGAMMEMCSSSNSWLEAAILYGDNERIFQELSNDLQFCVDCASELTRSLSFTFPLHKSLNHVDVALLPNQAIADFKRDIARLNAKLEDLVGQLGSGKDEVHLAQYLLDRRIVMPTSDSNYRAQSSRQPVFASQDPTPSVENPTENFFEVNRHYPAGGVTHKLGSGTAVFTVDWLGLKCAKKEFDMSGYCDDDLVKVMKIFEKEVSALQGLNHRNIVRLLCSQSGMPKPSILMEFVEMNLREFLNKRKKMPIDLAAAVDIMLQMGLGMEYLHGKAVVHRDLKAPNILVSSSRHPCLQTLGYVEVKLTDFGLAKVNVRDVDIPTYKMIGTRGWRAPEAENPRKGDRIDWRLADTYSFAMICSEILTFETPPGGRQRPLLPRECPDYLREFLERCWAENPKSRPYFEEIVSTLKTFKLHLLLGTVPECVRTAHSLRMHLFHATKKLCTWSLDCSCSLCTLGSKPMSAFYVLNQAELEHFKATIGSIKRRLKLAGSVLDNMIERRRQVILCPTQCSYLVDECMNGLEQVTSAYHRLDVWIMVDPYPSMQKKIQDLANSLDGLICSLKAATELVVACSGRECKTIPLTLSAPLPLRRVCSRFGYCLWELHCSLYVTRSHLEATFSSLVGPISSTSLSFKWSNHSCKFVLVGEATVTGLHMQILCILKQMERRNL